MRTSAALLLLLGGCTLASRAGRPEDFESMPSGEGRTAARLRAGEVDDNEGFADYLRYFKAYPDRNVRKIDITDRMLITFVDAEGRPMSNSPVRLFSGRERVYSGVTTAGGRLMFPPRAVGVDDDVRQFTAEIEGRRVSLRRGGEVEVAVDGLRREREEIDVDLAFCLDTTGSMGDEIDAITRTLRDLVARIDGLHPRPRLRFGLVCFRDRGDEYVTRVTDFTRDPAEFQRTLDRVRAAGGGDYEEAVSEALCRSVDDLSWRDGDAIRILFLIGDAPPHTGDSEDYDYSRAMRGALAKGIKIFTLAASGLNDKGEFIWRQLAQFTLAKFMFISYGGGTPHHVGEYRENNLDDLLFRAVRGEVESLRARHPPSRLQESGKGRAPDDFREWSGQK